MMFSELFFIWVKKHQKLKTVPGTKNLTVFYFGNSETRYFCTRYHARDLWPTTLVVSSGVRDPGKGSSCWPTIEGRQLQSALPGWVVSWGFYKPQQEGGRPSSWSLTPPNCPRTTGSCQECCNQWAYRRAGDSPHVVWPTDSAMPFSFLFFFPPVGLISQSHCHNSTKEGVLKYQNKPTHSANSHDSSQSHWGIWEPHKFIEINT